MRSTADANDVFALVSALAPATGPTRLYLVGGATAVVENWRPATVDVDLHTDGNAELEREIIALQEDLGVAVDFGSPADYLPEVPGWRRRSPLWLRIGLLEVRHYDLYAQALAKLERDTATDLLDLNAMVATGAIDPGQLAVHFAEIEAELQHFPDVDADALQHAVHSL